MNKQDPAAEIGFTRVDRWADQERLNIMEKIPVPRYWTYVHDENGDLVEDDYTNDYTAAIISAAAFLVRKDFNTKHSIHIVDQHEDNRSVWIAGPCTVDGES